MSDAFKQRVLDDVYRVIKDRRVEGIDPNPYNCRRSHPWLSFGTAKGFTEGSYNVILNADFEYGVKQLGNDQFGYQARIPLSKRDIEDYDISNAHYLMAQFGSHAYQPHDPPEHVAAVKYWLDSHVENWEDIMVAKLREIPPRKFKELLLERDLMIDRYQLVYSTDGELYLITTLNGWGQLTSDKFNKCFLPARRR